MATDTTQILRIIRHYYKQLYINKLDNLEELNTFLETYNLTSLNHEEIENLKRCIMSKEIGSITKNFSTKRSPAPNDLTSEFYKTS